jgi:hypothetical protein
MPIHFGSGVNKKNLFLHAQHVKRNCFKNGTPDWIAISSLMVNTFLLDSDFRKSAAKLNWQRLGKQRVEAYQIHLVLVKYRFLASYYNIPDFPVGIETTIQQRETWVAHVMNTFKSSHLDALHVKNGLIIEYPKGSTLPRVPKSGNHLCYDVSTGIVFETSGKRSKIVSHGPWYQYVQSGILYYISQVQVKSEYYLVPNFGSGQWQISNHKPDLYIVPKMRTGPMINLWLGFEDALKAYTNAHIEEWIHQGRQNNMKFYHLPSDVYYQRPKWTYSEDVINNFKSTLIEREIERHEDKWYMDMPDFVDSWVHSPNHGKEFNVIVQQLPLKFWWHYVSANHLLQYGRFPGFLWP